MKDQVHAVSSDSSSAGPVPAKAPGHPDPKVYFHKLRLRLIAGTLSALILPLLVLSLYFHLQFNSSLKESGKLHLEALAESQRNTIDLFLQERVTNIFNLFHGAEFSLTPTDANMEHYLQGLRQASDAFIDVGFFDAEGVQIGYAGPYPFLSGKDYSRESWFVALKNQDRNYFISDIYLGFRNKPHFTIAVKQSIDGRLYVLRATLDPDKFYVFLRTISRGKGVESYIVNEEGRYQVVDPDFGQMLEASSFVPPVAGETGVEEVGAGGDRVLRAFSRLKETNWVLVARQPLRTAYAAMYRARNVIIIVTVVIVLALVGAVGYIITRLLTQAEATAEAREELRYQLLHASKLASVGELAAGVAHEINNPLAIIGAETGVIRDLFDPELGLDPSPSNVIAELDQIDAAVFRTRGITQKLLNFARKSEPKLTRTNINRLLDEVVSGLKEREFAVSNIKLIRAYDLNLPELMIDRDQISQVFLNLINNAGDAIPGATTGTVTLATSHDGNQVRVAVTDTGTGMVPEQMKRIFLPFYTTKEPGKGTGLGLPVSLSIVEAMGGTIEVQSVPGAGSSFTVLLPIQLAPEGGEDEHRE